MTISAPELPDLTAAFKVETTLELVDHEGLGIVVSELNSIQQAEFLTGLAEGFSRFDDAVHRGLHLAYIAAELKASPGVARGIWELLHEMAEHLAEVIEP